MSRPTQAIIDFAALRHNTDVARSLAPESKLMAVVKANAYGHGAVAVAQCLQDHVDAFAVACIEEAQEIRAADIHKPILLLEGVFHASELELAAALDLWVTIASVAQLEVIEKATLPKPVSCWLKVDTGMHRLGVSPAEAERCHSRLASCKNVVAAPVLFTHFAGAEEINGEPTKRQLSEFAALEINASRSACNSAGLLAWPSAHYDWVRPGYMLYGNSPFASAHENTAALRQVMTLRSAISSVRRITAGESVGYEGAWVATRDSRIATVPIGYGDGYPRSAPAGTPVLVNEQRSSLAGRVSMDILTIDLTDLPDAQIGDAVILWGEQLPLAEIAEHAGTNGYELTTRMPARTPRIIVNA